MTSLFSKTTLPKRSNAILIWALYVLNSYLIEYVWELGQLTELYKVQPGHVCYPSARLWLNSLQVQGSSSFDECHELTVFHLVQIITFYLHPAVEPFNCLNYKAFSCDATAAILVFLNKKRRPYWSTKPVLLELNSIYMQTKSFVSINQYGGLSREWKRSTPSPSLPLFFFYLQ